MSKTEQTTCCHTEIAELKRKLRKARARIKRLEESLDSEARWQEGIAKDHLSEERRNRAQKVADTLRNILEGKYLL